MNIKKVKTNLAEIFQIPTFYSEDPWINFDSSALKMKAW
jgi:hypothetical protein